MKTMLFLMILYIMHKIGGGVIVHDIQYFLPKKLCFW